MKISRDLGEGWQELLASEYVDPRELKASSSLRELAVVYLQEMRDKGRSEKTVPRYAAYVSEFLNFMERDGTVARVTDVDIRALKAFSSHLTRRRIRNGRNGGRGAISAATKNLHLIALRQLLKFGVLIDLPVPGPEKVMLDDQWTVVTVDRQPAAHFEHTIAVTDTGCEILTNGSTNGVLVA